MGVGQQQGSGRFPSLDDLPFLHSPSLFLYWFQMAEHSPTLPRMAHCIEETYTREAEELNTISYVLLPQPSPSLPYYSKCATEKFLPCQIPR